MKNLLSSLAVIGAGLLISTQALAGPPTVPSLPGPAVFGLVALGVGAAIVLARRGK